MGGTTAKSSIIENGELLLTPEYEVGGGMSSGHRLLKGSGYILRVPSIDLAEVSAGGGSLAWLDKGGGLSCGPKSAGAVPGPASYGKGGEAPTVTDANMVLGFLNGEYLLGGNFPVFLEKAREAILTGLASALGISSVEAAWGVHQLVNSNMARALAAVSSERGRDPRRFALMAFGGGGPLHGAGIAKILHITKIIIPPSPGVFSSFGLLFSDVQHYVSQAYLSSLSQKDLTPINEILKRLRSEARILLEKEGYVTGRQELVNEADLKYSGQTSHLKVNFDAKVFDSGKIEKLISAFHQEHEANYGYHLDSQVELVNLRVLARGIDRAGRIPKTLSLSKNSFQPKVRSRKIYQGPEHKWVDAPVLGRLELMGKVQQGPAIIEEYDSTTLIPIGWEAVLDRWSNIVVEKEV